MKTFKILVYNKFKYDNNFIMMLYIKTMYFY